MIHTSSIWQKEYNSKNYILVKRPKNSEIRLAVDGHRNPGNFVYYLTEYFTGNTDENNTMLNVGALRLPTGKHYEVLGVIGKLSRQTVKRMTSLTEADIRQHFIGDIATADPSSDFYVIAELEIPPTFKVTIENVASNNMPLSHPTVSVLCDQPKDKLPLLQEANDLVHGDRAKAYGHPSVNFGNIAKMWSVMLGVNVTPEQVAYAMILVKISRQINSPKRDNMLDIAGYVATWELLQQGTQDTALKVTDLFYHGWTDNDQDDNYSHPDFPGNYISVTYHERKTGLAQAEVNRIEWVTPKSDCPVRVINTLNDLHNVMGLNK